MTFDWQTAIALACVAAAASAVMIRIRAGWRALFQPDREGSGCGGGCHGCPSAQEQPLIEVASIKKLFGRNTLD